MVVGADALCALSVEADQPIAVTIPNRAVVDRPAARIFDVRAGLRRLLAGLLRSAASRSADVGTVDSRAGNPGGGNSVIAAAAAAAAATAATAVVVFN